MYVPGLAFRQSDWFGGIGLQAGPALASPLSLLPIPRLPLAVRCSMSIPPSALLPLSGHTRGRWSRGAHIAQGEPESQKEAGLHLLQGHCQSFLDEVPIPYHTECPSPTERYEEVAQKQ